MFQKDSLDGIPTNLVAKIGQRAFDAGVAPGLVLPGHPYNQAGEFVPRAWSTRCPKVASIVFLGDEFAIPPQDGIGRGNRGDRGHGFSPRGFPQDRQPATVCIR
jgi:hypothetical protein